MKKLKKAKNKKIKTNRKFSKKIKKASIKPKRQKITKRKTKSLKPIIIQKFSQNPVVAPLTSNNWEAWQTFNPGVILLNDEIHFLYRAIGEDGISRLGYAASQNGFIINERLNYPVYEHKTNNIGYWSFSSGGSLGGAEDPRLTKINDENKIYMLYTACDNGLRVGLTSIYVNDFLNKNWKWAKPKLISPPNEIHKNWVLFPKKIGGKYAILHSLVPYIQIAYLNSLDFKEEEYIQSFYDANYRNENSWDWWIRGVGPPPLETKLGWLVFYHAMKKNELNKYRVGAMILDYNNPQKIILKSNQPLLEPEKYYENNGFKSGVVYLTGAVIKNNDLLLYYGAADSYVSVAYSNLDEFLWWLKHNNQKIFKSQTLKIKK